ncbi:hypothetical protein MMC30_001949 [Trapelia coarctata]|nr:hypothetical protein [Trapelia coarctata]
MGKLDQDLGFAKRNASTKLAKKAVEEELANLEEKFAALEKKFNDLPTKACTITENSTSKITETAVAQPLGEKETGPTSRARIVINRTDPKTGERKDQLPSDTVPVSQVIDTFHAFTLRKIACNDTNDCSGEIEILSEDLWNLLREHLGYYLYHIFQGSPVILDSPYTAFILNWENLEEATAKDPASEKDRQARSDLKLLLDTIVIGSGDPQLDKYFKVRGSNKGQKSVTFETLWTIFSPGELVYGKPFLGHEQDFTRVWPYYQGDARKWSLICWTYDWDGKMFKRRSLILEFEQFDGHKPITSLPYYPFKFNDQHAKIKERLVERGKRYQRYCRAKQGLRMFDYSGEAVFSKKGFSGIQGDDEMDDDTESSSNSSDAAMKSPNVESRVMVDFESYFRYGPAIARVGSLILCGDSDECECLECQENIALKTRYRTKFDKEERDHGGLEVDDIVSRKGEGLVILLYGPPGVGKTSTAETVAIAAQKPLLQIGVVDVGTKAKNVETNLAKIFALATSWQAILLIDEADIFLESRGKGMANNIERNALVSVFLRVLEYYQGILMLTTNQIAQFDVAVQSRIHIAIKYGKLKPDQTLAIFEGFLKPLDDRNLIEGMEELRDWLKEDVCNMGLDGRQIRNIVSSALGLARAEGKGKLTKKDIKKILKNVKEFKDDFLRQFEKYKNEQGGMIG